MPSYDAIVVGTGGVGSAALWQLARRGLRVLGIDRFNPLHDRGSSHGHTRIIRQAYYEHPNYVPLAIETYRLWHELEQACEKKLFYETGVLQVGPADGEVVPGVIRAAEQHGLTIERLNRSEIQARWPALRVPEDCVGTFEPHAGLLLVEQCVAANLAAAEDAGAELCGDTVVENWQCGGGITLQTNRSEFTTDRLVITAGSWAPQLLSAAGVPLRVVRKSMFWFQCQQPAMRTENGCPVFLFELPNGVFYGTPIMDSRGIKLAEHTGGRPVDNPLSLDREIDATEQQSIQQLLNDCLPGVAGPRTDHAACMYTLTPDSHFVVDQHPADNRVLFAAGLSGHGFKFTAVLGAVLADLAIDGQTERPIDFLRVSRFND